jgi:hypothetical protein
MWLPLLQGKKCKKKMQKSKSTEKRHHAGDGLLQSARRREVQGPRNAWGILTEQAQMRPLDGCKGAANQGRNEIRSVA